MDRIALRAVRKPCSRNAALDELYFGRNRDCDRTPAIRAVRYMGLPGILNQRRSGYEAQALYRRNASKIARVPQISQQGKFFGRIPGWRSWNREYQFTGSFLGGNDINDNYY